VGERRSEKYGRRLTGAKGVGRLAAHKLARELRVVSLPASGDGVEAILDWDAVEAHETFDDLDGIPEVATIDSSAAPHGTTIELVRLRERWTKPELDRFLAEVSSFQPPQALVDPLPPSMVASPLLFDAPLVRSAEADDPGFSVLLGGEFETGDSFWPQLRDIASWVLEVTADQDLVRFAVAPTAATLEELPGAEARHFEYEHHSPADVPRFQARVVIREGRINLPQRTIAANSGVRVYVEGFRVLPYGEPGDDWLSLNQDATGRTPAGLRRLRESGLASEDKSAREELSIYSNLNYHGAVFLADQSDAELRMLVNREGFIPDARFEAMREITRLGIDLSTRIRARYRESIRAQRRKSRASTNSTSGGKKQEPDTERPPASDQLRSAIKEASDSLSEAVGRLQGGDKALISDAVERASRALDDARAVEDEFISEASMLRVLASVGLQMSAVVHELVAVAAGAGHLAEGMRAFADQPGLASDVRRQVGPLAAVAADLQHSVDRQAEVCLTLPRRSCWK
jgi:hypothetical protein